MYSLAEGFAGNGVPKLILAVGTTFPFLKEEAA